MKKFISGLLVGFVIATCGLIYADNVYNTQKASFKVLVNGTEYNNSESPALVVNDRTYLPVKGIGEALGVPVNWNQSANRVEVGNVPAKGGNTVVGKGNTLDTGEGFEIKVVKIERVSAYKVFDIELTASNRASYDMSNLGLSGYDIKLSGGDIKAGTIEPEETIRGKIYFQMREAGNGNYILTYKNKQTQLDISTLAK